MNKTKEMVLRTCILLGICSATLGINSMLHGDKTYNEDKLTYVKKEEVVKLTTLNNYDIFMKIVDDNRLRQIKEMQEKEKLQKIKRGTEVTASRGGDIEYDMTFELTFYSGLNIENSKYGAVNCKGIELYDGIVANNVLDYGTKIKLEGWGEVEVLDTGGNSFNSIHRLDVYVPRIEGETDKQYYRRVNNMGRVKMQGKIIK